MIRGLRRGRHPGVVHVSFTELAWVILALVLVAWQFDTKALRAELRYREAARDPEPPTTDIVEISRDRLAALHQAEDALGGARGDFEAIQEGLAKPILVGRPPVIASRLERYGLDLKPGEVRTLDWTGNAPGALYLRIGRELVFRC